MLDFVVLADFKVRLKEREKSDEYLDLAKELKKKLWNMKVTVIMIEISAPGTVIKGMLQELEDMEIKGRVEVIQNTALLRSARIPRKVLVTWGDLLSFRLQRKTVSLYMN